MLQERYINNFNHNIENPKWREWILTEPSDLQNGIESNHTHKLKAAGMTNDMLTETSK